MINSPSEEILDWSTEAQAIIDDVKNHVNYIAVSKILKSSKTEIFLNLRTIEKTEFCIRASGNGFQIVAEEFDKNSYKKPTRDDEEEEIFETPYALLNKISPSYTKSFANQLRKQLEALQKEMGE
ncbi:GSK3B-interacting protein [Episyrphus balteatus]|uniref:GSK3B-interacting protein n=1 Tax=Episyrphus balteatus TaxID=286459 RepID=UPI0024862DBA|nr:GSK3B-interacting protein [Episyrphus balteatus]